MSTYDIVPVHLAVTSMRDSGYKNATYALAELIDNAIQANANSIHLLCREKEEVISGRVRRNVDQIAVVDNGTGMDAETLRQALQFGNGKYLKDRSGIGRFGMGLPNSSLSQATRVEVWTWQNGLASAIYTYLDLAEIQRGTLREVPLPKQNPVPRIWHKAGKISSRSGTLVVWTNLDRCQWKTAQAIIRNSEFTIGRIYRRFISEARVAIRTAAFTDNPDNGFTIDEIAKPNDPLYLLSTTSCPDPWSSKAMFEPYGSRMPIDCTFRGQQYQVFIQFSVARKDARGGHNPGAKAHGEHAKRNVGVSIMRADRELELQTGWTNHYDPRERWWGAEIEIPPALDEVFGVTNDKQNARALSDYSVTDLDSIAQREGFDSVPKLKEAWGEDKDSRLLLLEIKIMIETNLAAIRKRIQADTSNTKEDQRHPNAHSAEEKGTEATKARQKLGHEGTSDRQEAQPPEVRLQEIASELKESGLDEQEANTRADLIVSSGRKYEFVKVDLDSSAFFTVRSKGGTCVIQLNSNHPAYKHLMELLEDAPEDDNLAKLRIRMHKSFEGLKLLLEAWARYEDELSENTKDIARDARAQWGLIAREFMRDD